MVAYATILQQGPRPRLGHVSSTDAIWLGSERPPSRTNIKSTNGGMKSVGIERK